MTGKSGKWKTRPAIWQRLKPEARRMRRQPTEAEARLWQFLKGKKLMGLRFRRQHPIGRFIADFYCADAGLVIEVDGPGHTVTRTEDAARDEFLGTQGLRVLRLSNDEVLHEVNAALEKIATAISRKRRAAIPE